MEGQKCFAVVGGDARQAAAARALARAGYSVGGPEMIAVADYILLPLPLDAARTPLAELLRAARPGTLALGGMLSEEAKAIAAEADVMIVIGGKHSSNSRKLYEICQRECVHTYFIQTLDDLHLDLPKAVRLVGITAGASTPNKLIEEVQNYVRINF